MDLRVFWSFGVHGLAACTALTSQNSKGIAGVSPAPSQTLRAQLEAVLSDFSVTACKTGMLATERNVRAVADALAGSRIPLVVDPVFRAKDGTELLPVSALRALKKRLLPLATLITPNLDEVHALTGMRVIRASQLRRAAAAVQQLGVENVLITGGHFSGEPVDGLLTGDDDFIELWATRARGMPVHGTGCAFSAAITAMLAQGIGLTEAVRSAKTWITHQIVAAEQMGRGNRIMTLQP